MVVFTSTGVCSEPGSNWRPFPLQGNALPTELSERVILAYAQVTAIVPCLRIFFNLLLELLYDAIYAIESIEELRRCIKD